MTTSRVPPTLPRDCTLVKRHCQSFPKRVPVLQSWSTDSPSICLHLKKTLASRRRIQPQDSLLSPTDAPTHAPGAPQRHSPVTVFMKLQKFRDWAFWSKEKGKGVRGQVF